jgi:hypothetical protein
MCCSCAIPTALLWHEHYPGSQLAALMTWVAFAVFCVGGYLTGTYLPVIAPLQCIVLQWNPFFLSRTFLEELHQAVEDFSHGGEGGGVEEGSEVDARDSGSRGGSEGKCLDDATRESLPPLRKEQARDRCRALGLSGAGTKQQLLARLSCANAANAAACTPAGSPATLTPNKASSLRQRKKNKQKHTNTHPAAPSSPSSPNKNKPIRLSKQEVAEKVAGILRDNACLRFAHHCPRDYLHLVGHLMVMFEMAAVLLPSIAIGISWITALCPDTPVNAFVDLIGAVITCCFTGSDCDFHSHCILR